MRKILFLDRDGTLVLEPEDKQVDAIAKVRLMPGVIPALLRTRDAGYEFVIVSNQDGMGSPSFPWIISNQHKNTFVTSSYLRD